MYRLIFTESISVGVSLGSFIGGFLFSQMKGAMVYRVSGLAALLACVLHASVQFFLKQRQVLHIVDDRGKLFHIYYF